MDQAKVDILIHLAKQSIYCVDRGQMVVSIDNWKVDRIAIYQSLHKSKYIRKRKMLESETYQLSKRGWSKLTQGQKQAIIGEYEDWVERVRPTVVGPQWLEWI